MGIPVHTLEGKKGGAQLSDLGKLSFALLMSVAIPGPVGEATGAVMLTPGVGYTSIPTATPAVGSGGTFTPSMAIATSVAAAAGATYAPGDTITLTGGTAATQAILEALTTKAILAPAVAVGGTGYVVGDTITLLNGVVVTVATVSTGAVATITLTGGGSFTTNNTSAGGLTQVSTSGVGTGATFTMTAAKYGVNTYAVQNAGTYSALPSSPISQGSTSGSGSGFTLTASTWQVQSIAASGGTGISNGTALTFTGGGGTTQATAQLVTNPIGEPVQVPVAMTLPPTLAMIQVTPNGQAIASITNKSQAGFTVIFTPRSTSEAVLATSFDGFVAH